jgi:hypothetical protein
MATGRLRCRSAVTMSYIQSYSSLGDINEIPSTIKTLPGCSIDLLTPLNKDTTIHGLVKVLKPFHTWKLLIDPVLEHYTVPHFVEITKKIKSLQIVLFARSDF